MQDEDFVVQNGELAADVDATSDRVLQKPEHNGIVASAAERSQLQPFAERQPHLLGNQFHPRAAFKSVPSPVGCMVAGQPTLQ